MNDQDARVRADRISQIQDRLDDLNELFFGAIRQINEGPAVPGATGGYALQITGVSQQVSEMIDTLPSLDHDLSEESLTQRLRDSSEASEAEARRLESTLGSAVAWLERLRHTMEQFQAEDPVTTPDSNEL